MRAAILILIIPILLPIPAFAKTWTCESDFPLFLVSGNKKTQLAAGKQRWNEKTADFAEWGLKKGRPWYRLSFESPFRLTSVNSSGHKNFKESVKQTTQAFQMYLTSPSGKSSFKIVCDLDSNSFEL